MRSGGKNSGRISTHKIKARAESMGLGYACLHARKRSPLLTSLLFTVDPTRSAIIFPSARGESQRPNILSPQYVHTIRRNFGNITDPGEYKIVAFHPQIPLDQLQLTCVRPTLCGSWISCLRPFPRVICRNADRQS